MGLDNIKGIMIGTVMFIIIITTGVFMLGSFRTDDSTLDSTNQIDKFNSTLDKTQEITSSVNDIKSSVDSVTQEKVGPLGWIEALVGSAYSSLKAIGGTLSFIGVAIEGTAGLFGIPSFILVLLSLIIVILIGFAIWSAIFKV